MPERAPVILLRRRMLIIYKKIIKEVHGFVYSNVTADNIKSVYSL